MVYATHADDRDHLDHVVDTVTEDAGGDVRVAILELVRRQHGADDLVELVEAAPQSPRRRRCA